MLRIQGDRIMIYFSMFETIGSLIGASLLGFHGNFQVFLQLYNRGTIGSLSYMMGLEQTELMAKKWNIVKKINIVS